jgi:hypothetical protein
VHLLQSPITIHRSLCYLVAASKNRTNIGNKTNPLVSSLRSTVKCGLINIKFGRSCSPLKYWPIFGFKYLLKKEKSRTVLVRALTTKLFNSNLYSAHSLNQNWSCNRIREVRHILCKQPTIFPGIKFKDKVTLDWFGLFNCTISLLWIKIIYWFSQRKAV